MIALFLAPLYYFGVWFLAYEMGKLLKACSPFFARKRFTVTAAVFIWATATLIPLGFVLPDFKYKYLFEMWGNIFFGIKIYAWMIILCFILLELIVWMIASRHGSEEQRKLNRERFKPFRVERSIFVKEGLVCLVLILGVSLYGIINSYCIRTTDYEVKIDKKAGELDELNLVLIADLHLGTNVGSRTMRQMVEKINRQDPDIVVIAGDFFNNDYDAMKDPEEIISILGDIKTKYGVYATYGNHDVSEPILAGFTFNYDEHKESDPRMEDFLKRAGIQLLRDESTVVENSFVLCGRADQIKPGRGIEERKSVDTLSAEIESENRKLPMFMAEHEPVEYAALDEAGFDLCLSGHTHDGQFFPLNLMGPFIYENAYGYVKQGGMQAIVTSGVGLYGPNIRVGTISEICNIHITFE